MKEYLKGFMEMLDFPAEARECLIDAYEKINKGEPEAFSALISEYEKSYNIDYVASLGRVIEISRSCDVHEYTGQLLLFMCYSRGLARYYEAAGLDLEIYRRCMMDLKYKLIECKLVHNVWGSFVAKWFARFFYLDRFAFGKLQFEIERLGATYEKNGISLNEESPVINVHIPRTGTRLDEESRKESYRLAAEFFTSRLNGAPVVFVCHSWLLFPRHSEMLKPTSNLWGFISDYDLIKSGNYDNYGEVWRLFDTMYDGDPSKLPDDTSLRRAYVKLIESGEKTGWGKGVYIY